MQAEQKVEFKQKVQLGKVELHNLHKYVYKLVDASGNVPFIN